MRLIKTSQSIADMLAKTFAEKSSSNNYKPSFQLLKGKIKRKKVNFSTRHHYDYNTKFYMQELKQSLNKSKDTSGTPDGIHYQMIKHLPETSLQILLDIYNNIFTKGIFPAKWQEATIIPIAKPGKDYSDPPNYRPISLTSCLCKTMEGMINSRQVWYFEKNNIISRYQNGFRQHRSTTDQLVQLETLLEKALSKNNMWWQYFLI